MTDTTSNPTRLVLGDDTVICRDCWEPDVLELDPSRVPIGETDRLPCSICGANDIQDGPCPSVRRRCRGHPLVRWEL